jgi:hypothetical protein
MRTKEELRKEFDFHNKALNLSEAPFWMLYSQFLEQKLIDQSQEPKQMEVVVQDVLDSMIGIGGIPSNEEFYNEFNFRLQNKLGIKQTEVSEEDNKQ